MTLSQLSARRPYLLRAFYDWLLDNQLTPHLVVDVTVPGVQVPMEFARDGQIVLNIAPRAVGNLELADDCVRFNARFGGVPRQVFVPMASVMAFMPEKMALAPCLSQNLRMRPLRSLRLSQRTTRMPSRR